MDLHGRVAAVTGGAQGIGRAMAEALVARGMRVAIGDLDAELAVRTAETLGGGTRGYPLDVTDEASFTAFLDAVEIDLGPPYAVLNNAGVMLTGMFAEETPGRADAMIAVNAAGVARGCRLALPGMLRRGQGHIVNSSSTAGRAGYPGIATYSATKFFVYGLSEALRAETRGTGVSISCVLPGFVDTDLTAGVRDTRLLKRITPAAVAAEVVDALERRASRSGCRGWWDG